MSEVTFDKYEHRGAYHWTECFGPLRQINAYTLARYAQVLTALRESGIGPDNRVLDVGCGDGALTGMIAMKLKADVTGIDATALSINLAEQEFSKRGLQGEFKVIEGYTYPWPNQSFDAVVCADVIEHVQKPGDMLLEMWRVLAPGGVMVVTTPIRYTETPMDRLHVREWFPQAFKSFCSEVINAPVELRQSHPVALVELYDAPVRILNRISRFVINLLAKLDRNPFLFNGGLRIYTTQTVIAKKPR